MLFLTEKLLKAAGFAYDEIDDAWVIPAPLHPEVTVECDEDGAYLTEALREVHAVLEDAGCTYSELDANDSCVSVAGLTAT